MSYFQIRTDLALEGREYVENANGRLRGVIVEEYEKGEGEIFVTKVQITTKNGSKLIGKPVGTYITLEIPGLSEVERGEEDSCLYQRIVGEIRTHLCSLLPREKENTSVLVVGLGNRDVTADALGPLVIEKIEVTRHIWKEFGIHGFDGRRTMTVSAVIPDVMAKTGMESAEIVKGIVEETRPEAVIVVDALAARSVRRLNRTIQLSNTGIHPGSGVGNHRNAIDSSTLHIPVVAIGVPTVVDAATIVSDALNRMHEELKETVFLQARETSAFAELNNMYVTPKDIDQAVARVSSILAEALNLSFQKV